MDLVRSQLATLQQLLEVHEEQARHQFDMIRRQQETLEERAREIDAANRSLAGANAMLQDILRVLPGALLVIDHDGVVRLTNDTASTMLERTAQELQGMSAAQIFAQEDPLPLAEIQALEGAGAVFHAEKTVFTGAGHHVPVLVSAAPLRVADSDALGSRTVCIAIDIRERRRLESELRQSQKLEAVGRLASGIAHEINTPTQFVNDSVHFASEAVGDLLSLLGRYKEFRAAIASGRNPESWLRELEAAEVEIDLPYLTDSLAPALSRAADGLDRITSIVRSMKEFAHPDASDMVDVDLNHALQTTLTIARNEYTSVADIETDFGALPLVPAYPGELNQALLNVLVNAAHAVEEVVRGSDRRGRIRVATRLDGDWVEVTITDTGGGIPESIQERIFDPFFTTKEVGRGTGQGLAVTRGVIVEKHGGALDFRCETGHGTTFSIRLPLHRAGASTRPHDLSVPGG
ncbi:MAG: ATP-binding protein [Vicinamibacterales bacterium]